MRKPRILNPPETIYLNVGPDLEADMEFNALEEVTWCGEKIDEFDIEYRLVKRIRRSAAQNSSEQKP